jgi:hypothetical protein
MPNVRATSEVDVPVSGYRRASSRSCSSLSLRGGGKTPRADLDRRATVDVESGALSIRTSLWSAEITRLAPEQPASRRGYARFGRWRIRP